MHSYAQSRSMNLVFRALGMNRATHHAYLAWRLLEMFGDGVALPTNAGMAAMLGLAPRSMQAAMMVLQGCGLLRVTHDMQSRARIIFLFPYGWDYVNDVLRAIVAGRLVVAERGKVVEKASHVPIELPVWEGAPRCASAPGYTPSNFDLNAVVQGTYGSSKAPKDFCASLVLSKSAIQSAMNNSYSQGFLNNASSEVPEHSISTANDSPATNQAIGPKKGRPKLPITEEMRLVHANWAAATGKIRVRTLTQGPLASNLRARLADGFSVDELQLVARWAAQDPWLNGTDPKSPRSYLGIDTLYRSRDRTDKYLEQALAWQAGRVGGFDRRALALSAETPVVGTESF